MNSSRELNHGKVRMKDSFWINHYGTLTVRNLFEESKKWDRSKFLKRDGLDLYNYMWQETMMFREYNADGCMYEVGGVRVGKGDTVVDIGANIGMWSLRACDYGAADVISFEPVRLNFVCLCLNTAGYPVRPYNLAIGDRVHKSTMRIHDNMGFCSTNKDLTKESPTEDLMMVTMDWLFDVGIVSKIDFLKIDIEGFEDRVLFSISKDRLSKIKTIALEYHVGCPVHHEEIIRHLRNHGINLKFRLDLSDNMKIITFTR